jgi:hypothetical protein
LWELIFGLPTPDFRLFSVNRIYPPVNFRLPTPDSRLPSYLYSMKYVLYALLIWFLYQFIFKLVIPVYKASRKIKKGFGEMQEKMNEQFRQQQQQQAYSPSGTADSKSPKPSASDYIEFEEVK